MLKIWGRLNSINVQKVVWAAEEAGVPYERVDAGLQFGIVNTPEYRRMNPNGLVPVIDDDGFILWESNAILRYLAAKYPAAGMWPDDIRARANADRWCDWIPGTFYGAYGAAFMGLVRTPVDKRDAVAIEASRTKADALLAILDDHLADHKMIAGAAFSYGDIVAGTALHRWLNMPVERSPRPAIARWYGELMQRPAAQKVLTLPIT